MRVYNENFRPYGPEFGYNGNVCWLGGSSESKQEQSSDTVTTTNTETNQTDARKGVSDQGILLEQGAILDQSSTIEDVNAEVIATALQPVEGVIVATNNLVNRNAQVTESFLDESGEIFGQAVGFSRETQSGSRDLLQKVAGQNAALATKFLDSSKDLVQDANTGTGEKLGGQAILLVGVVALGGLAFIALKK